MTSHVVPSNGEALAALAGDTQHAAAAERFSSLEPLDTFVGGRGFVHWFTAESLAEEVTAAGFAIERAFDDGAGGFEWHLCLRAPRGAGETRGGSKLSQSFPRT